MDTKRLIGLIVLAALFMLVSAGCTQSQTTAPAALEPEEKADLSRPARQYSNGEGDRKPLAPASFSGIKGHIHNLYYAGGDKVIVSADRLYLYDLDKGITEAEAPKENVDQESLWVTQDGYVLLGTAWSAEGGGLAAAEQPAEYRAVFYDSKLNKKSEFSFNSLLQGDDMILSQRAIAFSEEGNRAAFAAMNGLYLFDFETKRKTTVIDLSTEDAEDRQGLAAIEQIAFTDGGKALAFKAQTLDVPAVPGKPSYDTCGTVKLDGSELSNRTFDGYTCKEITAYDNLVLLAEDFTIPSGRLLKMQVPGGATSLYTLASQKESGFVAGSDTGQYFATTAAGEGGWTVRIYRTDTGELEMDRLVESAPDPLYMAKDPIIRIIDETRTYIVLLGAKQAEIETQVIIGRF